MSEKGLTAAGFATWLTPRAALALVDENVANQSLSMKAIIERLKGGQIYAVAKSHSWENREDLGGMLALPMRYWNSMSSVGSSGFWISGDARFFLKNNDPRYKPKTLRCYGIRFWPVGVHELVLDGPQKPAAKPETIGSAPQNATPPAPQVKMHPGGRPRKEFWDDLWIAIFERLTVPTKPPPIYIVFP